MNKVSAHVTIFVLLLRDFSLGPKLSMATAVGNIQSRLCSEVELLP